MGWAVGEDRNRQRHIGYGVPALCDHPGCETRIDRGFAYACGGDPFEHCGLFFCLPHLDHYNDDADNYVCERCANDQPPFEPSPDVPDWVDHVATDKTWATWRSENPEWLRRMQINRSRL
ncbi:hypothetical protein [Rhodococcoides fascians]|uniref:hypothetical protein n=1 Tax=Rhodococcoides fascians TaxID=1828 RepID=UPI00055E5311|nr:hypothetical protein [Rhodococcus fascians]